MQEQDVESRHAHFTSQGDRTALVYQDASRELTPEPLDVSNNCSCIDGRDRLIRLLICHYELCWSA